MLYREKVLSAKTNLSLPENQEFIQTGFAERIIPHKRKKYFYPAVSLLHEEMRFYEGAGTVIVVEQYGFIHAIQYIVKGLIEVHTPYDLMYEAFEIILESMLSHQKDNIKFWLCLARVGELRYPIEIKENNIPEILQIMMFHYNHEKQVIYWT